MNDAAQQGLPRAEAEAPQSRPVLLHVSDDVDVLHIAKEALEDAGFDVLHAHNGLEATECFKQHNLDVIIMDAILPVMNGFDSIRGIRSLPGGKHIPILMVTGPEDSDSINKSYETGATDFIIKPIDLGILRHRMQSLLRFKQIGDALRLSQRKLDKVQRIARLGNWEWNLHTDELAGSLEFGRVLGVTSVQSVKSWNDMLSLIVESDRHNVRLLAEESVVVCVPFNVEFSVRSQTDNVLRRLRLEAEPDINEQTEEVSMMGTIQDITERTNAQKQIHNLAYYDLVTGLPNRAQLHEQLNYTLQTAARKETRFAVLMLDLDHFKQVNDTLGHDAGDDLLKQVSSRLSNVVRESDVVSGPSDARHEPGAQHTVARLGGDEFIVLLGHINRAEDAARVAERIATAFSEPYQLSKRELSLTTTIGISVYPTDGADADAMMKSADVAMYHAKESGRNGYQFYSRDIHERALARISLESELKSAIENEELTIAYQPKISLETGRVIGVEALARWNHRVKGPISPVQFIPLAEESGLILPLGQWMLKTAAKQMRDWHNEGLPQISVAVNCSSVQFRRSDMVADINDAIEYSDLDPRHLEIELTESLVIEDFDEGVKILRNIKELGVQVSIDDFGTGFSSLSYLKRLPVDKLKIDKSFIDDLCTDSGDMAIVSAIVTLSHNLGLVVVAEGVETLDQYDILKSCDCDEGQGYLFGKPMDATQFRAWFASDAENGLQKAL